MKFKVTVTREVEVTLNARKFNEQFMSEFRDSFYNFHSLEEHAEHLAQLFVRGLADPNRDSGFIEGYGNCREMGIGMETLGGFIDARKQKT